MMPSIELWNHIKNNYGEQRAGLMLLPCHISRPQAWESPPVDEMTQDHLVILMNLSELTAQGLVHWVLGQFSPPDDALAISSTDHAVRNFYVLNTQILHSVSFVPRVPHHTLWWDGLFAITDAVAKARGTSCYRPSMRMLASLVAQFRAYMMLKNHNDMHMVDSNWLTNQICPPCAESISGGLGWFIPWWA